MMSTLEGAIDAPARRVEANCITLLAKHGIEHGTISIGGLIGTKSLIRYSKESPESLALIRSLIDNFQFDTQSHGSFTLQWDEEATDYRVVQSPAIP